jgi:tripartite-type tricarboxylate transporter receptor subunit TctC
VPYRGGAPLLTEMLAGVIPVSFNVIGEVLPHIRAGKLRALAVCSAERSRFLPEVPTMIEQGVAGIGLTEWLGWFLPAKTPTAIVQRLNSIAREGLESKEMIDSLATSGLEARHQTPEQFAALMKQDYERWAGVAKLTGFTMNE